MPHFTASASAWCRLKACCDPFTYAVGLRDGTVLRFTEAQPIAGGDWVQLFEVRVMDRDPLARLNPTRERGSLAGINPDRGLDIALREIVWVADAPDDS